MWRNLRSVEYHQSALQQDYVRAAIGAGFSDWRILWRHVLRNALTSTITQIGLLFGLLLAGAVVIETVFSRPGIGRMVVNAILEKDFPIVQGTILVIATTYVVSNLLVDIAYAWLDPRVRFG